MACVVSDEPDNAKHDYVGRFESDTCIVEDIIRTIRDGSVLGIDTIANEPKGCFVLNQRDVTTQHRPSIDEIFQLLVPLLDYAFAAVEFEITLDAYTHIRKSYATQRDWTVDASKDPPRFWRMPVCERRGSKRFIIAEQLAMTTRGYIKFLSIVQLNALSYETQACRDLGLTPRSKLDSISLRPFVGPVASPSMYSAECQAANNAMFSKELTSILNGCKNHESEERAKSCRGLGNNNNDDDLKVLKWWYST